MHIKFSTTHNLFLCSLQIVSSYKHPDRAELNYHAGVSIKHKGSFKKFIARHKGVQFLEKSPDIILAGLLYCACFNPHLDLPKIHFITDIVTTEVIEFMKGEITKLSYIEIKSSFYKQKEEVVEIYCLCQCPWIEGTTSKAIYGEKAFDYHMCTKCTNWSTITAFQKSEKRFQNEITTGFVQIAKSLLQFPDTMENT